MNEDIPKIGCVQHDCDACANQAAQIAALEAKVATLRAALVGLAKEVEKRVADPAPELRYAMAKARSATEATK